MALAVGDGKAAEMAIGDVPGFGFEGVGVVAEVGGAIAGIVPRVGLFEPPDFEDIGVAVADGNGADGVPDVGKGAAGVLPVVDEGPVGADPLGLAAGGVGSGLGVAEIIFDEGVWHARGAEGGPDAVGAGAGATVNLFTADVGTAKVLPPVEELLAGPSVGVTVREEVLVVSGVGHGGNADLPHVG